MLLNISFLACETSRHAITHKIKLHSLHTLHMKITFTHRTITHTYMTLNIQTHKYTFQREPK